MPRSRSERSRDRLSRPLWLCVRCARLLVGAVNGALAALAVVLGAILVLAWLRVEIPVPRMVLERLATRLHEEGLRAGWSRIGFDLTGRIHAQGFRLVTLVGDPVLEASQLLLSLDKAGLLLRQVEVTGVRVEGGTLILPAYLAPEGTDIPVLEQVSGSMRVRPGHLAITFAQAMTDDAAMRARGPLELRPPSGGRTQSLAQLLRDAAQQAQLGRTAFAALESPSLEIDIEARNARLLAAGTLFRGHEVHGIDAVVHGSEGWTAAALAASVERITGPHANAEGIRLTVDVLGLRALLASRDWRLLSGAAHAARVQLPGGAIHGVHARPLQPGASPLDGIHLAAEAAGGHSQLSWQPGAEGQRIEARGELMLADALSLAGLPADVRETISSRVRVYSPLYYRATALIPPVLADWRAEVNADAWDIDARGTGVDHAHVAATLDARQVDAWRVWLNMGSTSGDCAWLQDLETLDWRLQVKGAAYPQDLGPALGRWWQVIWPPFDFDGPPPLTDLEVRGNWHDRSWAHAHGTIQGEHLRYNGVRVDTASLQIRSGNGWLELHDLDARNKEGQVAGTLSFLLPRGDGMSVGYDLRSSMPLEMLDQAFQAGLDELAEPWSFEQPPTLRIRGNVLHDDEGEWTSETLAHAVAGQGQWRGIEFQSLSLSLLNSGDVTHVGGLRGRIAGGLLTGSIRFTHPRNTGAAVLCDLRLMEGRLTPTLSALQTIGAGRPPDPPLNQRQGNVNLDFRGGGYLAALGETLSGRGSVQVSEADLGQVGIFGALSTVLNSMGIGLSTFNFDSVRSGFHVIDGLAIFEGVEAYGPAAHIEARGVLSLVDKRLDFDARVFLMRGEVPSIRDLMGLLLSPFGYVLELRLRGTLDEPTWRFKIDPRNIFDTSDTLPTPWQAEPAPQEPPRRINRQGG